MGSNEIIIASVLIAEAFITSHSDSLVSPLIIETIDKRIVEMHNNHEEKTMSEPIWIDVRTAEEFAAGHYPGAINIPYEEIENQIDGITSEKSAPIHLYCRTGRRSGIARDTLSKIGYTLAENKGGLEDVMPDR